MRQQSNFAKRFKGESVVQPSAQKFSSSVFRKFMFFLRHPAPMKRDVSADRHDTWGGDAMDADGTSDERGGCGRRNRVVLIPRCWDQALQR
jgi:hypothetical protein